MYHERIYAEQQNIFRVIQLIGTVGGNFKLFNHAKDQFDTTLNF